MGVCVLLGVAQGVGSGEGLREGVAEAVAPALRLGVGLGDTEAAGVREGLARGDRLAGSVPTAEPVAPAEAVGEPLPPLVADGPDREVACGRLAEL